jgi:hypothetical protein
MVLVSLSDFANDFMLTEIAERDVEQTRLIIADPLTSSSLSFSSNICLSLIVSSISVCRLFLCPFLLVLRSGFLILVCCLAFTSEKL